MSIYLILRYKQDFNEYIEIYFEYVCIESVLSAPTLDKNLIHINLFLNFAFNLRSNYLHSNNNERDWTPVNQTECFVSQLIKIITKRTA